MKILIVEDDVTLGELLRDYLEQLGHEEVRVFTDGNAVVSVMEANRFDCAFIDLKLPDIDGITLLARLKEKDPTLPVIMMSGYPTMDSTIEAMRQGASDFLQKPFTMQDVVLALERVTKERALLLENLGLKLECQAQRELKTLNQELRARIEEKEKLFEISWAIDEVRTSDALYQTIVRLARSMRSIEHAGFYIYLPDYGKVALIAQEGSVEGKELPSIFPVRGGSLKKLLDAKERPVAVSLRDFHHMILALPESGNGSRLPHLSNRLEESPSWPDIFVRGLHLWPLWIRTELFGFLLLCCKQGTGRVPPEDVTLLEFLMTKAALAVENMALYESLIANFYGILRSLVNALEAKDPYTGKHSERVTFFAVRLAEGLGCSNAELDALKTVGYLHDIGKIGVADAILNKPGPLTPEEYEIVKRHPVVGEEIVSDLGLGYEERSIIRHHHERWDGRGYPDGLRGDRIPRLARIVAVADAFDAMTSKRAYRKALPVSKAIEEIRKNAGTQFDPQIAKVFFLVFNELMEGIHEEQRPGIPEGSDTGTAGIVQCHS